jgi:transposase
MCVFNLDAKGEVDMNATTNAVDLAKNIFAVCSGDAHGHGGQSRLLKRVEFLSWLRTLPAGSVVAMEACGSAHHWARTMQALGLRPRLIAAEFVRPYRKNQRVKNDHRDAEAILAALHAPGMRFVTPKTAEQQQRLCWHRLREGWKAERTALLNRIRGLLAEMGIIVDIGAVKLRRALNALLDTQTDGSLSPEPVRLMVDSVRLQLDALDARIGECDMQIARQSAEDPVVKRLRQCPSIGPLIADALTAAVGDARQFKNGRQFAASLGITPSQHGSGGKARMGKITRRGDSYLRGLLIHSAGSVLNVALRVHKATPDKLSRLQRWMVGLYERRGYAKTKVAIANKHARQAWAMLTRGQAYNADAWREWENAHAGVTADDRCDDDGFDTALPTQV